MGLEQVSDVNVDDIQKRINPKKHYVYRIQVTWDDDAVVPIYRSYDQCLQLEAKLKSNKELFSNLCNQSGRPSSTTFLQGDPFFNNFKRRKRALRRWTLVEEFLKLVVSLSPTVSESDMITNFFKPLFEDLHSPPGEYEEDIKSNWNRIRMRKSQKKKIYCHYISEPILLEQYVVIEDYPRNKTNDMNLKRGNIVDVIEKDETGWWFVDLDGYLGWVPASYLKPRDDLEEDPIVEAFESGKEELYITIQDYEAKHEDEVGFQIGELVLVSQKSQDGWWLIRARDQKGWAPAMFLREIAMSDSRQQDRDPDRSEVLREKMVETVAGLYGHRKTWKPSTRRGLRTSRKTKKSTKRSVMFLNEDPIYANVEHKDSLGKIRTNKAENPAALTRENAAQEDHPDNYQEDSHIYSTAAEACAQLSFKKRLQKHQDNKLKVDSTGDVLQKTNIAGPKNTSNKENDISLSQKNHEEIQDANSQDEKSVKVPASNTFDEPVNGINRKTSLGEQSYVAINSYDRENEDEVNLSEGAPVKVLEKSDGGWWLVKTKSFSVGWAPSNFLIKSDCDIQEDEKRRLKQRSIKPARPPKTRHVQRMAKECKEENDWLYYQQKQQQQVRKKSASEATTNVAGPSQLPSSDTETTRRSLPAEIFEEGKNKEAKQH